MTVGYKGTVTVDAGYMHVPYNAFKSVTWQDKLQELEIKFASWLKIGNVSRENGLDDVNLMMQTYFPGKYQVIEAYDTVRGVFAFKLQFESPKEETMFRLKWS